VRLDARAPKLAWVAVNPRAPARGIRYSLSKTTPAGDRLAAGTRLLFAVGIAFGVVYALCAAWFIANPGFPASGPGDLGHATVEEAGIPQPVLTAADAAVVSASNGSLRAAHVPAAAGGPVWVVYSMSASGVFDAAVIDEQTLLEVTDANRIKPLGAWPYIGLVKAPLDWGLGLLVLAGLTAVVWRWSPLAAIRPRLAERIPGVGLRRVLGHPLTVGIASTTVVGLVLLWLAPGWNRWRKWVWQYRWIGIFASLIGMSVAVQASESGDPAGMIAADLIAGSGLAAWAIGWFLIRPAGAEVAAGRSPVVAPLPVAPRSAVSPGPPTQADPIASRSGEPQPAGGALPAVPGNAPVAVASPSAPTISDASQDAAAFTLVTPDRLPSFADVGGMDGVKRQIRDTIGLLLSFPDEALAFKVDFNGVLLFGPPGTGKTFIARAVAGEYACNFISVGSAELISGYRGQSARRVREAFAFAEENPPAVLFFDEIDAIAGRRDDDVVVGDDRQTLTQLMRSLEAVRQRSDIIVVAATNAVDDLDPALVRPGRFDRKIRVDLPDERARQAVFRAQLAGRPVAADIDLPRLAQLTEGFSAAAIAAVVDRCALEILREVSEGAGDRRITHLDLERAVKLNGGQDRPSMAEWDWDDVILPAETKRELMELQRLIEDPDRARRYGVEPPRGALLFGPPGTGKTTIAKVLAAQAKTSFYPIKGTDIISKWLGDSEQNVAQLFARARENRPSIIFLDEIDAIAPRREAGFGGSAVDRVVNQLLQEIDGLGSTPGVFVLGATNRRDILDEALLRGGRLGRQIEIPNPDEAGRLAMLRAFTGEMMLAGDVDLPDLARRSDGRSGADLRALCQQAAIHALMRAEESSDPLVEQRDFTDALATLARGVL